MRQSSQEKNGSVGTLVNINIFLFALYAVFYMIIITYFKQDSVIFDFKHYLILFNCFIAGLTYYFNNGKHLTAKNLIGKNVVYILLTGIVFIIVSYICAHNVHMPFSFRSVVQTSLFVLPLLYTFFLVNILDKTMIIRLMKISTLVFIVFYFLESRHTILSFFDISNWMSINLLASSSFTESHNCAEVFLQLFVFFYYVYYFGKQREKRIFIYLILTLIFSILSFKRLSLLFCFILILGGIFIKYDKKIKINFKLILSCLFVIITIFYVKLLVGKISIGIDMNEFTTNRVWFMQLWSASDYFSYGYGTSLYVIGRYLEMDLVQIYFELGLPCLFIFIVSMFKMADNKVYTNIIVLYVLFNLLTSSTMPWTFGWVILGLNLMTLSSDMYETNV